MTTSELIKQFWPDTPPAVLYLAERESQHLAYNQIEALIIQLAKSSGATFPRKQFFDRIQHISQAGSKPQTKRRANNFKTVYGIAPAYGIKRDLAICYDSQTAEPNELALFAAFRTWASRFYPDISPNEWILYLENTEFIKFKTEPKYPKFNNASTIVYNAQTPQTLSNLSPDEKNASKTIPDALNGLQTLSSQPQAQKITATPTETLNNLPAGNEVDEIDEFLKNFKSNDDLPF